VLDTHSIRLFPLHFSSRVSPCATRFRFHSTAVETEEDLIARLPAARETVQKMPGIFEKMRQNIVRRCSACSGVGG